ncbi:MAG: poly-gamma-glutamate system protein [Myxococcota bacterium]
MRRCASNCQSVWQSRSPRIFRSRAVFALCAALKASSVHAAQAPEPSSVDPEFADRVIEEAETSQAKPVESESDAPVLLMNPNLKTIKDFVFLVENRVLTIPELRLVALYHRDSTGPFREARDYLRRHPRSWLSVQRTTCRVTEDDVLGDNSCRAELAGWVAKSRAMIFTGGTDLLPSLYGQPTRLTTKVATPQRNIFEVSALHHLVGRPDGHRPLLDARPDYTILAICLGMQTLNVALGGTLHQDIPTDVYGVHTAQDVLALPKSKQHTCYANQVYSSAPNKLWTIHPVRFGPAWSFGPLPDSKVVNAISYHHQAVDKLGGDLRVSATSTDGEIVEGVHHAKYPNVFGVQFHPEYAKAWTAQRPCPSDESSSSQGASYALESEMASFYQGFWRSFSERVISRNVSSDGPETADRRDAPAPTRPATDPTSNPASKTILRAQKTARRAMSRGLTLFEGDRVPHCSVLGRLSSPITSKIGLRPAKVATCDPEFAAILVQLFDRAGLEPGDVIGVALSGSFPALNLATIAASEAMNLKPVVVSSLSSSMFGANQPDQTWVDMESRLIEAGVIKTRSRAVTLGGKDDNGAGLPEAGVRLLRAAVRRNPVPLLQTRSLSKSIRARLHLYRTEAGPDGLKAFVNVGGGKASIGTLDNKRRFQPGLNPKTPRNLDRSGIMAAVSRQGVPVIYIGNIRRLCQDYGLKCFESQDPDRSG